MSSSPPDGVSVRQATDDDASAVDELIKAADTAVQGWSESSVPELLGWWRIMDLDHDSWLLYEGNNLVAYAAGFAHSDTFELDGFVHPEQRAAASARGWSRAARSVPESSPSGSCRHSHWPATTTRAICSSKSG